MVGVLRGCGDLIGVVHLPPLPGSPLYQGGGLDEIVAYAVEEAERYQSAGFDAVILENYGDKPFSLEVSKAQAVSMALVSSIVRREVKGIGIGVNMLRNDAYTALTVAVLAGLDFIRVNSLCELRVSSEGFLHPASRRLVEAARDLNAIDALKTGRIRVLADVDVKHSTPLGEYSIEEASLECMERLGFRPWALVVSGRRTGEPPSSRDLESIARVAHEHNVRIYAGSGASLGNVGSLLRIVDGIIVGSSVKAGGRPESRVDMEKAARLAETVRSLRGSC